MTKDDVTSSTVATESTLLIAEIDAKKEKDVATCNISNAFIQIEINKHDDGAWTFMRIRGSLVNILCGIDANYAEYVILETSIRLLYVQVLKPISPHRNVIPRIKGIRIWMKQGDVKYKLHIRLTFGINAWHYGLFSYIPVLSIRNLKVRLAVIYGNSKLVSIIVS